MGETMRLAAAPPASTVEIRAADEVDLPAIAAMLFTEFPDSLPLRQTADLALILAGLTASPCVIGAFRDGDPVGCLVLSERRLFWSPRRYWGDQCFFVSPRARASRVAYDMVKVARAIVRATDMPLLLAVINSQDVERKEKWFLRNGFRKLGGFYILED